MGGVDAVNLVTIGAPLSLLYHRLGPATIAVSTLEELFIRFAHFRNQFLENIPFDKALKAFIADSVT